MLYCRLTDYIIANMGKSPLGRSVRQMSEKNNGGAAKTISAMAIIIMIAKVMGLLRETLVAGLYGQGTESDMINTATQIPLLFFDMVLGVAILSTFVPIFNKHIENEGKAAALDFANNFASIVGVISVAAAALGMIFANKLVGIMVPGYADIPGKVEQTATLLRILFPSIVFTAAAYIAVGILQSFGEFTIPSLISVVSNGIMILYLILFGNKLGLVGVAVSMLIAWAMQLAVQVPHLIKFGCRYKFRFDIKDKGIKEAALIALPVLVSSWVQPLCNVINMSFGSNIGDGAVSALNWANKIYIIMVGVFAYAITNFIFPKLSRLSGEEHSGEFAETARNSVGIITAIIGIVCALFLALSNPIISVVFERGEFTAQNAAVTGGALFFYSFGMIGYAMCEVLNKSFYALSDGKTPMFTSIIGIIINLASAAILVGGLKMQVGGLALAAAISSNVMAVCLLYMINRRRPQTVTHKFVINLIKIIICSAAAFAAAKLTDTFAAKIGTGTILTLIRLCVCSVPAVVIYTGLGYVLGVTEIRFVFEKLRRK